MLLRNDLPPPPPLMVSKGRWSPTRNWDMLNVTNASYGNQCEKSNATRRAEGTIKKKKWHSEQSPRHGNNQVVSSCKLQPILTGIWRNNISLFANIVSQYRIYTQHSFSIQWYNLRTRGGITCNGYNKWKIRNNNLNEKRTYNEWPGFAKQKYWNNDSALGVCARWSEYESNNINPSSDCRITFPVVGTPDIIVYHAFRNSYGGHGQYKADKRFPRWNWVQEKAPEIDDTRPQWKRHDHGIMYVIAAASTNRIMIKLTIHEGSYYSDTPI